MTTRRRITPRNRAAFTACRRILKLVRAIRQRSSRRASRNGGTVDLLLDKTDKTARAVILLGSRGYAEDSLVLARSLANLAIDVSYLKKEDADRFVSYRAVGREARRRMAEQCGCSPPDAAATDWDDVKARAKRWQRGGSLHERAKKANRLRLYEYAYRHGSSFEHSDAWSLLTYEPGNAAFRDVVLHLSLLIAAYALVGGYQSWCLFFGIEDNPTDDAIKKCFMAAFPGTERGATGPLGESTAEPR